VVSLCSSEAAFFSRSRRWCAALPPPKKKSLHSLHSPPSHSTTYFPLPSSHTFPPPLPSSSTPTPPSPHLHHSEFPTALPRSRNCLVAPTLWFLLSPSTTPGCNIFTTAHPQLPTAATTTGCCRCSLPSFLLPTYPKYAVLLLPLFQYTLSFTIFPSLK